MREMSPDECARLWGITKREVMMKIYGSLAVLQEIDKKHKLPPGFTVRRVNSDNYIISVPEGYKFEREKKK